MKKTYKAPYISLSEEYNPFEPLAADNVISEADEETSIGGVDSTFLPGDDNEEWEF